MQLRPQTWRAIAEDWRPQTPVRKKPWNQFFLAHCSYKCLTLTAYESAGSPGKLTYLLYQAGRARVRASPGNADCARRAGVGDRIKVLHSKVEDLDLHGEKVDILISEPMGTLLVNERMLETYLYARDHFLKPNGQMFPVSRKSSPCIVYPHSILQPDCSCGLQS